MKNINQGLGYLAVAAITCVAIVISKEFSETIGLFAVSGIILVSMCSD